MNTMPLPPDLKAKLYHQWATLLEGGVILSRVLRVLQDSKGLRGASPALRNISAGLNEGRQMGESMRLLGGVFESFEAESVAAGETSGKLELVLRRLANYWDATFKAGRKIKSGFAYPLLVVHVTILASAIVVGSLKGWGAGLSQFISSLALFYAFGWLIYEVFNNGERHGLGSFLNALPWVGDLRKSALQARFVMTFRILLEAGIPTLSALPSALRCTGKKLSAQEAAALEEQAAASGSVVEAIRPYLGEDDELESFLETGMESGRMSETLEHLEGSLIAKWNHQQDVFCEWVPKLVYFAALGYGAWQIVGIYLTATTGIQELLKVF